jgi:hypothetical protein
LLISIKKECFYFGEQVQFAFKRNSDLIVNTSAQIILKEESNLIGVDSNNKEESFRIVNVGNLFFNFSW